VACEIRPRRIHLLALPGTDSHLVRHAAGQVAAGRHVEVTVAAEVPAASLLRSLVADLVPTFAAAVLAVVVAGAGSVALSRALQSPLPRAGPGVAVEQGSTDGDAVRTVVPAPEARTEVLGAVIERPADAQLIPPLEESPPAP